MTHTTHRCGWPILSRTSRKGGVAHCLLTVVILASTIIAHAAPKTFSVAGYGAKPDGTTLNTAAIQRTIDAAAAHHGTVTFPDGTYLTGALFIKSGVTLRIDKGVTLTGSQNIADYPELPTRVAGIEMTWPSALINVYQQTDATLTGEGTIDGNGKIFWDSYWALRRIDEPKGLRWASDYDARRPRLIQVFDSSNIHLGNGLAAPLNLHRSGFWTVHICYSHDVTVDGVTIRNNMDELGKAGRGPSTDGIDIDSSHHIEVMHADISVNDDALCLKAGRDSDGLRVNRPTTDIKVHDNIVRDGAAGITFGSETSGGFRNIEGWNITTEPHVPVGILFKSAHTRGGFAEDIRLHDFNITGARSVLSITMNWNPAYSYATIPAGLTDYPGYYKTLTTVVPPRQGIAHVHDLHIWNIKAVDVKTAFTVDAYPNDPVYNVRLDHLDITAQTAGHIDDAKDWTFSTVSLKTADGSVIELSNASNVKGIPTRAAPPDRQRPDPAKRTSAEQDKSEE